MRLHSGWLRYLLIVLLVLVSLNYVERTNANTSFQPTSSGLLILLDASQSMNAKIGDLRKIDLAINQLKAIASTVDPNNTGLRLFDSSVGHCESELKVGFTNGNSGVLIQNAMNQVRVGGLTPLAKALESAASDLQPFEEKTILYIGDGADRCNGKPERVLENLGNQGIKINLFMVGMQMSASTRKQLNATIEAAKNTGAEGVLFEINARHEVRQGILDAYQRAIQASKSFGTIKVTVRPRNDATEFTGAVIKMNDAVVGIVPSSGELTVIMPAPQKNIKVSVLEDSARELPLCNAANPMQRAENTIAELNVNETIELNFRIAACVN